MGNRSWRACRVASVAGVLLVSAIPAPGTPFFMGLGHLPGGLSGAAWAVSADGLVVVGRGSDGTASDAFRWTAGGGMEALGVGPDGCAWGVSADGSVVVGHGWTGSDYEAFRWTAGGGLEGIGGGDGSVAHGVSADGSVVVGGGWTGSDYEAFRWTAGGGLEGIGPGDGSEGSVAYGVSADGSVVVGVDNSDYKGRRAFRWTQGGGIVGLGHLSGADGQSLAYGVSADGSVVVGLCLMPYRTVKGKVVAHEAFRWTQADGMVGLGHLPGTSSSFAFGVSAAGSVVVGTSSGADTKAFLWDQVHGMRSLQDVLTTGCGLDLTGWSLVGANGVSADGRVIVGYGANPSGEVEAWIANVGNAAIPEPGSGLLLLLGLAGLARRRSRLRTPG